LSMRKLSKYMLRRKVAAWGWYSQRLLIIEFQDGRLALVDPAKREYRSIRAWNVYNRLHYRQHAKQRFHALTLEELLEHLPHGGGRQ